MKLLPALAIFLASTTTFADGKTEEHTIKLQCDPTLIKHDYREEAKIYKSGFDSKLVNSMGISVLETARSAMKQSFEEWSLRTIFKASCTSSKEKYYMDILCTHANDSKAVNRSYDDFKDSFESDMDNLPYCLLKKIHAENFADSVFDSNNYTLDLLSKSNKKKYLSEIKNIEFAYATYQDLIFNNNSVKMKAAAKSIFESENQADDFIKEAISKTSSALASYTGSTKGLVYERAKIRVELLISEDHSKNLKENLKSEYSTLTSLFILTEYAQNRQYSDLINYLDIDIPPKSKFRNNKFINTVAAGFEKIDKSSGIDIINSIAAPSNMYLLKHITPTWSFSGMAAIKVYQGDDNFADGKNKGVDLYSPLYLQYSWPTKEGNIGIHFGLFDLGSALTDEQEYTEEEQDNLIESSIVFSIGLTTTIGLGPFKYGVDISHKKDTEATAINAFIGFKYGILDL